MDRGLLSLTNPDPELAKELGIEPDQIFYQTISSLSDLAVVVRGLWQEFQKNPKAYGTVCLDNLTELQRILLQDRAGGSENLESTNQMKIQDWGIALNQVQKLVRVIRDLPCHSLFIAHEQVRGEMTGPALSGRIYDELPGYFDFVARYLLREREVTNDKGEKAVKTLRMLQLHPSSSTMAKDRSGKLDQFEKPNLRNLISKAFS